MVDWLQEIRDAILYEPINLWLGFSFLCRNSRSGDVIYLFACPQLSPFHSKFHKPSEFNEFIDEFKGKSHLDLLEETFVSTQDDNPFASSGFYPYKLICSYIWIRKYY